MIITRTPYRVSFAGGGSDLPDYYRQEPGMVLSCSIKKYIYINVHPYFFSGKTFLKYSKTEEVERLQDIEHPIFREVLGWKGISGVDIASIADIPGGTGLGSSSSFSVGLLHALSLYKGLEVSQKTLAEEACHLEIERLGEPIGKQDQYAAAFGGLNFIRFNPDETVDVEPLTLDKKIYDNLENNLMMFYTGNTRKAGSILKEQGKNIRQDALKSKNLQKMCGLACVLRDELKRGNAEALGQVLHESWLYKKELAQGISNQDIDSWYDTARKAGALGGKLLGAGGGGFLLFYVEESKQEALRKALHFLREVDFSFDTTGSKAIYRD